MNSRRHLQPAIESVEMDPLRVIELPATGANMRAGLRLLRSLANMREIFGNLDANELLKIADHVVAKSNEAGKTRVTAKRTQSTRSPARKPKGPRT